MVTLPYVLRCAAADRREARLHGWPEPATRAERYRVAGAQLRLMHLIGIDRQLPHRISWPVPVRALLSRRGLSR